MKTFVRCGENQKENPRTATRRWHQHTAFFVVPVAPLMITAKISFPKKMELSVVVTTFSYFKTSVGIRRG